MGALWVRESSMQTKITECGARIWQEMPDGTLNGHFHYVSGECDNEPSYEMGGPA